MNKFWNASVYKGLRPATRLLAVHFATVFRKQTVVLALIWCHFLINRLVSGEFRTDLSKKNTPTWRKTRQIGVFLEVLAQEQARQGLLSTAQYGAITG